MLMIMVSSSRTSMSMSDGSTATPSARRRTAPVSTASSSGSVSRCDVSSCEPSDVWETSLLISSLVLLTSSPRRRRVLELHGDAADRVVLAKGVALPVLRHQDASQVGVPLERDPEHVEDL